MNKYTAFCQEADGTGTVWISSVQADDVEGAINQARQECSYDWGTAETPFPIDDIHCLGIVSGENIKVEHWEDICGI